MLVLLTLIFTLLKSSMNREAETIEAVELPSTEEEEDDHRSITPFVLILILVGAGLTLLPEFFYLRDQFGWRMNTIFKFYFQTWILWSIAGAYATVRIWKAARSPLTWIGCALGLLLILGGLAYPVFGVITKTNNLNPGRLILDGNAYMENYAPGEVKAIEFLRSATLGVVAEAVGGSYSGYARISTLSGQPTVLGWPGHESQWRGGSEEIGSREPDIQRLYQLSDWAETLAIVKKYQIRYIYVGSMEKSTYSVNEPKFNTFLAPVFRNNEVTIYEVPAGLIK
jgi:uncharacterized membrane protein